MAYIKEDCDKCDGSGCSQFCDKHLENSIGYESCEHCKTCVTCDGGGYVLIQDEPDDDEIYADDGMTGHERREFDRWNIKKVR